MISAPYIRYENVSLCEHLRPSEWPFTLNFFGFAFFITNQKCNSPLYYYHCTTNVSTTKYMNFFPRFLMSLIGILFRSAYLFYFSIWLWRGRVPISLTFCRSLRRFSDCFENINFSPKRHFCCAFSFYFVVFFFDFRVRCIRVNAQRFEPIICILRTEPANRT